MTYKFILERNRFISEYFAECAAPKPLLDLRCHEVTLRLTSLELAQLEEEAGGLSLDLYIHLRFSFYRMTVTMSRLSVRITEEERRELQRRAGNAHLSEYVRRTLLGNACSRKRTATPKPDDQALSQILGLLGQTDVFRSLKKLSDGVRLGTLLVDDELRETIKAARSEIAEVKSLLMQALRTKER